MARRPRMWPPDLLPGPGDDVELFPVNFVDKGVPGVLLILVERSIVVQASIRLQQRLMAPASPRPQGLHVDHLAPLARYVVVRCGVAVEHQRAHLVEVLVEPALAQVLDHRKLATGYVAQNSGTHSFDPYLSYNDVVYHHVTPLQRVLLLRASHRQVDQEGADDADLHRLARQPHQGVGAAVGLEVVVVAVECADGRVVPDLLCHKLEPAVRQLEGLPEHRVEGFVRASNRGPVRRDAEKRHVRHAINGLGLLCSGVEQVTVLEGLAVTLQR
ncbi:terminase, putative [Babesia ovata]|uniref:Terminase, putative n=1 Tax=Babesia ovata TaxID=189622 RepID=A0A2H6K7W1_9APIC|nr:terminase, putative [Babesia ovata]GBE59074.1 terminase, putative [Babesia ovata]